MKLGQKISTTIPCSILDKMLMALEEVDLDLVPALLTTIIHVIMLYHLIFVVMVITEVGISLTPANFLYIAVL